MNVDTCHHVGLRVGDIDRAAQFYIDAFGATRATNAFVLDGAWAESLYGPHPGLAAKVCFLSIGRGGVVLFQFLEPDNPTDRIPPTVANLMHLGVQVQDVAEAVSRVIAAGGTLIMDIAPYGDTGHVAYCVDVDGNTLDIIDMDYADTIAATLQNFPDATPGRISP